MRSREEAANLLPEPKTARCVTRGVLDEEGENIYLNGAAAGVVAARDIFPADEKLGFLSCD